MASKELETSYEKIPMLQLYVHQKNLRLYVHLTDSQKLQWVLSIHSYLLEWYNMIREELG